MRIFTYPDPFEINSNKELWDIVTKHPHFCASDTLLQGLGTEYGRASFGILRTINSLVNKTLGEYVNNPQNDIQIFLNISSHIRDLPDSEMKKAFRFNIANVVESIKFLIMLECDAKKFGDNLTEEQGILIDIYKKVMNSSCIDVFKSLSYITKEKFIELARLTINEEIEYLCNRNPEYAQSLNISLPLVTHNDGYVAILKIIDDLSNKIKETPSDDISSISYDGDLESAKYILTLITETPDSIFDKIIIHGVHRITPTMYYLFNLLKKIGIEVIFLINYAQNLPNTYKTWREVYSWCDTKFEYLSDVNIASGKELGIAIANIIEGKNLTIHPNEDITVFSNLTSFTDREVRNAFKAADEELNQMRTQYYAVRGESSNEILKIYFPEQFNQKQFLSYPIGQFILGIYQMWDFEKNTLMLNDKSLCECAVSNIYENVDGINLFDIINKIKLYFANVETIAEYYKRIKELENSIEIINRNNRYSSLKKLSFFNVILIELSAFKSFLGFIDDISKKLFEETNNVVDFGKHFKTLIDIISIPSLNSKTLSKTEEVLIKEITDKLSACKDNEITGNIEDVKDALAFYLSANKKGDTSNWIVRDFDQIDGAVLLRKRSKASNYHFACLSNAQMAKQPDDVLPWPLSNNMFNGYAELSSAVPVVNRGLLEMRNFLKFSLFYGTFFTKCNIKLSYIAEENGEEQVPYYLLKILNLETKPYHEKERTSFINANTTVEDNLRFSTVRLDQEGKELFSICPYKFLQKEVLKSQIEYNNEFHIKYYVANFMFVFIKGNYDLKSADLEKNIILEFTILKRLFPFWDNVVFVDIEKNARKQLCDYIKRLDSTGPSNPFNELTYERKKENFLIAQWVDNASGEKQMNFDKPDIDNNIIDYMTSGQLYPIRKELPHKKVCGNCNFSDVCLRDYYNAFASTEGDE